MPAIKLKQSFADKNRVSFAHSNRANAAKSAQSNGGKPASSSGQYKENQWLVFGSETHGIQPSIRAVGNWQSWVRIPMQANSRSINLANSVAVILYEALRQLNFQQLG